MKRVNVKTTYKCKKCKCLIKAGEVCPVCKTNYIKLKEETIIVNFVKRILGGFIYAKFDG